jgi:hypothetical protein
MRKVFLGSILLLFVALLKLPTWAGTPNATVTGTVYSGGKEVAGATVHLINASIGFSQAQTTGADGGYTFTNVPPAEDYVISVEMAGFATQVLSGLIVQVGEEKLVVPPFLLQPSAPAAAPAATPPAAAPAATPPAAAPSAATLVTQKITPPSVSLDLLNTTLGGVIDSREVHTLPLVNRDFIDLALLVPGTYPVEQGSVLQGASLVVNGARADMNNFLLDGADNNDYTINQSLPFQIVEALQEFRVQASTEDAEYGRSGGAQINELSRSGSNSIHGELFEFNRNSALSSANFFSEFSGGTFFQYARNLQVFDAVNPLTDPTLAPLYDRNNPRLNQNQFGGDLGGALIKDKLFGFFNWESFRLVNPRPLFEQVPGTVFRSAASCAAAVGIPCDPVAVGLFSLYPAPNVPATPFTNPASFPPFGSGAFNIADASNFTNSDNFLERVDLRVSSRTSMSFKHNIQRINQLQAGDIPASSTYPGNGTRVNGRNQNFSYTFVQQLTSRTTNELRFGWNRFRLTTTAQDASVDPATLGLQNLDSNTLGLPTIALGGSLGSLGPFSTLGTNFATPSNRADNVWSVGDNLSLSRGRHTWKLGAEFRHIRLNVNNEALERGIVTLLNPPAAAIFGEPDLTSIARVSPDFNSTLARHFSTQSFGGYVQDQWRVSHNFTLNYGVRYELNTAPVENQNFLVNFYPGLNTTIGPGSGGLIQGGSKTIFDSLGNVIGTLPASGPAAPRAGYKTDRYDWGPRLGFAWDPWSNGKTVVRGGYALMFDQQSLQPSVNMLANPPFVQQDISLAFLDPTTLEQTFPLCTVATCRVPYSITAIDSKNKTPYVHQYHFGVEQRVGNAGIFEAAYVGSLGRRLPLLKDISACTSAQTYATFFAGSNQCFNFGQNPFLFTSILDQANQGNSNFNSLQLRFATRNFHGLQFHAFYQWAKSIDDASSLQPQLFLFSPLIASLATSEGGANFGTLNPLTINPDNFAAINNISPALSLQGELPIITSRPRLPQDSTNIGAERARSDFDIRHRAVIEYIYSVPRWAPRIGTGWKLAGITTLQSGQPYTVFFDYFGTPLRPNVTPPVAINNNNPNAPIDNGNSAGVPPSAFDRTPTSTLTPGDLGRNAFTGPKFINFDFSVLKDTPLGKSERTNVQFKVEFFNLFNKVNFRQPYSRADTVFFDATGSFTAKFPNACPNFTCFVFDPLYNQILQAYPARQIQFALKFQF